MTITVFDTNGPRTGSLDELPALLAGDTGTVWVDLIGPDETSLQIMHDIFHFHPLAIEDTHNHRQRPKLEEYADYLFLILNPVTCVDGLPVFRELDVFTGRNFVVTVRPATEPVIEEARRRIERATPTLMMSASYLLYVLVDSVVDDFFPVLDIIEEEIESLGDVILTRADQGLLNRLFLLKTALVNMWRVVWPQREMLNMLVHHNLPYVNAEAIQHYLRDVSDHLMWIADMVSTFRDTLTGMMDLYMSAVSNRLNRVVNRLTVFTVVIGSLSVIVGFYGMNFLDTWPPFDNTWGVPFVLALMLTVVTGLLVIFRRLKWY